MAGPGRPAPRHAFRSSCGLRLRDGKPDDDTRALAGLAVDRQGPGNRRRSIAEVGQAEVAAAEALSRIEPFAVVLDEELGLAMVESELEPRPAGAAVAGDVAEGLPGDLDELVRGLRGQADIHGLRTGQVEGELGRRPDEELAGHRLDRVAEPGPRLRSQTDDERPDVADGCMEP